MLKINPQSGSGVIEILIAATVLSIAFIAILSLGNQSIKSTTKSRDIATATTYSNQVIDWLRGLRDTYNWKALSTSFKADAGAASTVTYCLPTLPTTQAAFEALTPGTCTATQFVIDSAGANTLFQRELTVSNLSSTTSLTIKVETRWVDGSNPSSIIETKLNKTQ